MGYNNELLEKDLTFEEFEKLALNVPKRQVKTIFCLEEIDLTDDPVEMESMYPEFHIYRHIMGFFDSIETAKNSIKECISKAKEKNTEIYCFKLYELPLNYITNLRNPPYLNSIREYLYDSEGKALDQTTCSSLDEDVFEKYGSYLGKPRKDLRFKKGDIVEVIGVDIVTLGIVSADPLDTEWHYDLYKRLKKEGGMAYFPDYSDDQVPIVDSPEYGSHSHIQLCDMMRPRFPISAELRNRYESYLG